jgi:hypothetical protein
MRLRLTARPSARSVIVIRCAEKRPGGEQLVDPPHQREIVVIGGQGRPVEVHSRVHSGDA